MKASRFFPLLLVLIAGLAAGAGPLAAAAPARIVMLGDSLTAGYGLANEEAYPARLEAALRAEGYEVEIVNAGVSGDTTAGGLERLDWSVPDGTDGVILALGANDMLQGRDPAATRKNLEAIITRLRARDIPVMLMGMRAAPNLGRDYVQAFDAIYAELAARHDLVLVPFFLEGVAADPALNQADGIHPTAEGVEVMVANTLDEAKAFLARLGLAPRG